MRILHVFCILAIDLRDKSTKTVERTSENKNGFLAKDAAIVRTGSADFRPHVAVNLLAKIYFQEPHFLYKTNYTDVPRCNEME